MLLYWLAGGELIVFEGEFSVSFLAFFDFVVIFLDLGISHGPWASQSDR